MAQHTVYVTRKIHEDVYRHLARVSNLILWDEDSPVPLPELCTGVQDADGLLCMPDNRITREVIEAGPKLRVISTASTSYAHIDISAATERGITVCYAPGTAEDAIADMTMALVLACARHLIDAHQYIKDGRWQYWYPDLFAGAEMQGSAIGIIGLGNTGMRVAHRALGFGMRVFYYDPRRDVDAEQLIGIQYGSLDNVLREADFVTLHVPPSPSTQHLITAERLHLMKPTAYLINMAHGSAVDHDALVQALSEGWIAGAGLDVYDEEPIAPDDPLLAFPNVVFSPHLGANTTHAISRMMWMAAEQLIQVLQGHKPSHPVLVPPEDQAA